MGKLELKFIGAGIFSSAYIAVCDHAPIREKDRKEFLRLGPACASGEDVRLAAKDLKRELDEIVMEAMRKFKKQMRVSRLPGTTTNDTPHGKQAH